MIHLEKVTYKNEEDVISLDITESQYPFVADNVESLADAYVAAGTESVTSYFLIFSPIGILRCTDSIRDRKRCMV